MIVLNINSDIDESNTVIKVNKNDLIKFDVLNKSRIHLYVGKKAILTVFIKNISTNDFDYERFKNKTGKKKILNNSIFFLI